MNKSKNKFKLIDSWKDTNYGVTNYLYEFTTGLRLILTVNPATIDFDFAVIIRGGAFFEEQLQVPKGTAHFVEHLIFGSPNKVHHSKMEMDAYELGSKNRPSIYTNARVGPKNMYFYGSTNKLGATRLVRDIRYRMDYPLNKISKYIEKERSIILAEHAKLRKEERDVSLMCDRFFLSESYPEECQRTIGTVDSIKSVTAEQVAKYYQAILDPAKVMITVQTHEKPSKSMWEELTALANVVPAKQENHLPDPTIRTLNNKFRIGYFHDPEDQDVFISFNYILVREPEIDYSRNVLRYLLRRLISKVGFDIMREERGLIYSISHISTYLSWHYDVRGFKLSCKLESLPEVLECCIQLINKDLLAFLDSDFGKKWFVSQISDYIFPTTTNFNSNYAESLGVEILGGLDYKFNTSKARAIAKQATIPDLKKYIQERFQHIPPHLWVVSPYPEEQVMDIIKKSHLYQQFSTQPEVETKLLTTW